MRGISEAARSERAGATTDYIEAEIRRVEAAAGVSRSNDPSRSAGGASAVTDTSLALTLQPLTERERSLLALLPTHLTYAQIGAELFLSVNTVKSNLKAVYRKLGAGSRAEAVEVARRNGLLGPVV